MAILYFTNTADSGDGSLRQCIADAVDGDIIKPSEETAWDGDIIIPLSSQLQIGNKTLELNAGSRRVVLDGQGACAHFGMLAGALTVVGFDLIRGFHNYGGVIVANDTGASLTFRKCLIAGNNSQSQSYGDFGTSMSSRKYANITLDNCVLLGGRTSAFNRDRVNAYNINACTIAGYGIQIAYDSTNSILTTSANPASSCGFVQAPPDSVTSEIWTADLWRDWDVRLAPESPYLTGGTYDEQSTDFIGNARSSASMGAYDGSWFIVKDSTKTISESVEVDYLEVVNGNVLFTTEPDVLLIAENIINLQNATLETSEGTNGYFVSKHNDIDASALTLNGVKVVFFGSDVSNLAVSRNRHRITVTWDVTNNIPFLLEQSIGGGAWEEVAVDSSPYVATIGNSATFRTFNGIDFEYASIEEYVPPQAEKELAITVPIGYITAKDIIGVLN